LFGLWKLFPAIAHTAFRESFDMPGEVGVEEGLRRGKIGRERMPEQIHPDPPLHPSCRLRFVDPMMKKSVVLNTRTFAPSIEAICRTLSTRYSRRNGPDYAPISTSGTEHDPLKMSPSVRGCELIHRCCMMDPNRYDLRCKEGDRSIWLRLYPEGKTIV